jgi:thiosulfate/3-mercaptopyruvate sulfurtransferase
LQERFHSISDKKEVIAYCGSGVTGCVNVLALYQAGRTDAKLYAGSWSDWVSYEGNPVATGEE